MILAATGNEKAALEILRQLAWPDINGLSAWETRVALLAIELRGTLQHRTDDLEAALASFHLFLETMAKTTKV